MMLRANGSLGLTSIAVIAGALAAAPAIFHARTLFFDGKSPFAAAANLIHGDSDDETPGDLRVGRASVEGPNRSPTDAAPGQVRLPPPNKTSSSKPPDLASPAVPQAAFVNVPDSSVGAAKSFGVKGSLGPVVQQGGAGVPPLSRIGMIAAYASAMRGDDLEGAAWALAQASNRSLSADAVQALNAKLGIEADDTDVAAVVARATAIQAAGNGSP